jgi:hypothetical protein
MILLKTRRSPFECLRACPEFIEGTNGGAVEITGEFPFMSLVEGFSKVFPQNQ